MKNIKVVGERVLLQINILKDEKGEEQPSQEGKVLQSGVDDVKKGATVFYNPFGAVSINSLKTKKHMFLVVDGEDVYATL